MISETLPARTGWDDESDDEQDLLERCSLTSFLTWNLGACELWPKKEGSD